MSWLAPRARARSRGRHGRSSCIPAKNYSSNGCSMTITTFPTKASFRSRARVSWPPGAVFRPSTRRWPPRGSRHNAFPMARPSAWRRRCRCAMRRRRGSFRSPTSAKRCAGTARSSEINRYATAQQRRRAGHQANTAARGVEEMKSVFRNCLAAGLLAAIPGLAFAQTGTVKLGQIEAQTGPNAIYGYMPSQGVPIAVDEINKAGGFKVGDTTYKLDLIAPDTRGDPKEATIELKKLLEQDKVKFVFGPFLSNVFLTIYPYAKQFNGKFLMLGGGTRIHDY